MNKTSKKTNNLNPPDYFPGACLMDVRCSFHTLVVLLVAVLVVGAVYLTTESGYLVQEHRLNGSTTTSNSGPSCDLFSGKWVFDNASYPLYGEHECSFMSDQLACGKFGRKDLDYQHWRWQPHHCDLPRFNATALLEKLRNKRLVFVGDSLNRGQWVSMVCLLDHAIPHGRKHMHNNGSSLITFTAKEYNAKVEFYWAPLMVESNSDDPVSHRLPDRIVRAQAIEKHGRHWTDADILVFNTYLWWRRPKMKVLWGSFNNSDGIYKEVNMLRSYEMALRTWSDWLEIHVNRSKTQLYYMSMSPTHERAEEWGKSNGQNCYTETDLISKEGYMGKGTDPNMMRIVENTLDELQNRGLNVQMINITQLSEYRKEGHPSIYRKQWEPLTESQISNPLSYADCIHWCLPGVPDTWNELLYAYISNYHESGQNI
ncbi:Protein trichome birefringence-like 34 [Striga hermonthica]|uniref:Protein trichome birefringence-like 34 n=1 Tax=Striga hermonthica TaxID=68872 RepID=A0A9N7NUB5_STRHE|nr:Protein trichome birefringence-like 34 [Striga hermonthica]